MEIVDTYFLEIKDTIDQIPVDQIESVIEVLQEARAHCKQVFLLGNGGSASTASRFACDLSIHTRKNGCAGFRVIGLTDNTAVLSFYANNDGYENVFVQQLENLLQAGDVVIAISTSGNSVNVSEAVKYANQHGAITIGFTGMTGGTLKAISQHCVHVPSDCADYIEDIHLMLAHVICRALVERKNPVMNEENNINEHHTLPRIGVPLANLANAHVHDVPGSGELIAKLHHEMAARLSLHDLLARALSITVEYVGAVGGSITVLDEDGKVIDGVISYDGKIHEQPQDRLKDTVQHGLASWVLENRQPVLIENTKKDPRWLPGGWEASLDLSRSAICVPLLAEERVIGTLTLTRTHSNHFTPEDLMLLASTSLALASSFSTRSAVSGSVQAKHPIPAGEAGLRKNEAK